MDSSIPPRRLDPLRGKTALEVTLALGSLHASVKENLDFDTEMLDIICELALDSLNGRRAPAIRGS